MEDRYVSIKDAAKFLSLSYRQVRLLIENGSIPSKNVGIGSRKFHRVLLSDLVEFNTTERSN